MPPPNITGSQRNQRSCSASRLRLRSPRSDSFPAAELGASPATPRGRGSTPPTCAIAPTLPRHPRRAGGAIQALDQHTERIGDKRQVAARPWPRGSCAGFDAHPGHVRLEIAATLTYVGNVMEAHTRRRRAELGGRVDSKEAWAIAISTLL